MNRRRLIRLAQAALREVFAPTERTELAAGSAQPDLVYTAHASEERLGLSDWQTAFGSDAWRQPFDVWRSALRAGPPGHR